jgi:hypothetical protein
LNNQLASWLLGHLADNSTIRSRGSPPRPRSGAPCRRHACQHNSYKINMQSP